MNFECPGGEDDLEEFFHENPFGRYVGTDDNDIIQVKEDLTKKRGDSLTYALANRLTNAAIT
jgi:hypothetical protein